MVARGRTGMYGHDGKGTSTCTCAQALHTHTKLVHVSATHPPGVGAIRGAAATASGDEIEDVSCSGGAS